MSGETQVRLRGKYDAYADQDMREIVSELNRWSKVKTFTIASGNTATVAHGCDKIPTVALQVVTKDTTGTGVVSPGTGTWDEVNAYLTATEDGDYAVIFRR